MRAFCANCEPAATLAARASDTVHRVAGLLVIDGFILLEATVGTELWGIPGGRLEPGERLVDGCRREFMEELGIDVRCDSLAVVHESFWTHRGEHVREYGFYFRVSATRPLSPETGIASLEPQLKFRWCALAELPTLQFVPPALRSVVVELPAGTVFLQTGTPDG
jgi:8-oxo-dGTP diphosphatase